MTQTTLTLHVESELLGDVLDSLARIGAALPKRHGAEFRRLDRRLCRIMDGEVAIDQPEIVSLGGGRLVILPPKQLRDIVSKAAELGVI